MSEISVQDQITWEQEHAEITADRYYLKQDQLREKGRGDETDATRRVMQDRIAEVGSTIEQLSHRKGGVGGKYNILMQQLATFDGETDFNVLAYLGIKAIFQYLTKKGKNDWVHIASHIATNLEIEHKTRKFETLYPAYYHTVMRSMEAQQVSSQTHINNTIAAQIRKFEMEWAPWDSNTKIQIANKILLSIMHNLDDVFFRGVRYQKTKTIATIETTPAADDWLAVFEAERGYMNPKRLPTLVLPRDWIRHEDGVTYIGGYYSYRLTRPLVKAHTDIHKAFLSEHRMEEHIAAINKLQRTAWCVNTQVFEVQRTMFKENISHPGMPNRKKLVTPEIPEDIKGVAKDNMTEAQLNALESWKVKAKQTGRDDKIRKGKLIQFKMAYDVARLYLDREEFHYVYTADFRGRIYADTTGLSPQGNDTSKALLQFAKPKPVTQSGLFWLAVHGANIFGIDKISYDARVDWIYNEEDKIRAVIENPCDYREWWGSADKPWQFLAFCFAWAETAYGTNPDAPCALPIGLDGSCNGIQHYSALLRDKRGGASVNLTNSVVPADIYTEVAEQLRTALLNLSGDVMAATWLRTDFDRKLAKRPVMTLPYGSTRTSARQYLQDWAMANKHKFPGMDDKQIADACMWLTPHLWKAIGDVVVAARIAMTWIQSRVSKLVAKHNEAITWVSPAGFPVYQPYSKHDITEVITRAFGTLRIKTSMQEPTDEVSRTKQRSGIAPNFVHSLDSSHMVMVINATDFDDYAMIHDDFGTTAADVGNLYKIIREQFVDMYKDKDLLREWSNQQGHYDGEYPEMGDLILDQVLYSEYFFG
ncbi:MAG: hypothetical protein GY799_26700 [Desulfobulbaceae bacterium]|nr:hypothetical protein [Desulfobulbaceae bacterium]